MTGMRVISPGVLSLIQDVGRRGFQRFGVSVSGAMDPDSLLLGNRLVGNQLDFAAVEVTFGGAEFAFDEDAFIAITGADLSAAIDGTPAPLWESFLAPANSSLSFGAPVRGLRAYLCMAGGIASSPVLGSRSTHVASGIGGIDGGPLKAGDELPVGPRRMYGTICACPWTWFRGSSLPSPSVLYRAHRRTPLPLLGSGPFTAPGTLSQTVRTGRACGSRGRRSAP